MALFKFCPIHSELLRAPLQLKLQSQRKLNDPWIDRSCRNQSEVWRTGVKRLIAHNGGRNRELRVIKQIEELAAELNGLFLANWCRLRDREIGVGLAWTANDANAGVPEVRSVADGGRSAKRRSVEETLNAEVARSAEPVLYAPASGNLVIGYPRTELRAACALVGTIGRRASSVNCSAASIEQRERVPTLNQNASRGHPSFSNFSDHATGLKRQFVLITNDKPVRPAVGCLSVLLVHVVRVVQIR